MTFLYWFKYCYRCHAPYPKEIAHCPRCPAPVERETVEPKKGGR